MRPLSSTGTFDMVCSTDLSIILGHGAVAAPGSSSSCITQASMDTLQQQHPFSSPVLQECVLMGSGDSRFAVLRLLGYGLLRMRMAC